MRGGAPKATSQIQNLWQFLEAGIVEVPATNCFFSPLEFGARVRSGHSVTLNFIGRDGDRG
jgi:hypothetical protein